MKRKLTSIIALGLLLITSTPTYATTYKTGEDATAYINDPLNVQGSKNEIGYVAVHPRVKGGNVKDPIIPFGTYRYIDKFVDEDGNEYDYVPSPGGELTAVKVMDTGNVSYTRSKYFLDFYFDSDNSSAVKMGISKIDYHY